MVNPKLKRGLDEVLVLIGKLERVLQGQIVSVANEDFERSEAINELLNSDILEIVHKLQEIVCPLFVYSCLHH